MKKLAEECGDSDTICIAHPGCLRQIASSPRSSQ